MKQRNRGIKAAITPDHKLRELEAIEQEVESPTPGAAELERLHRFRPDLVDHCVAEHKDEIVYQRKRLNRLDLFVFAERMLGLLAVTGLSLAAFGISYLLAMAGHEWTACVISGGTIVGIVTAILKRNSA